MIRLAPGALIYFWNLKEGAYSRQGAYLGQAAFLFKKQQNVQNKT